MDNFQEIKRNRPDWSQILGQMAPGLQQGIGAQSAIQAQLLPLLFKAQLEQQTEKAKIDYQTQKETEKFTNALALMRQFGNKGDLKMSVKSDGSYDISERSPSERKTMQENVEAQGLSSVLPRFRKYGLHEATAREPVVGTERIEQLQGKLTSQFPSQLDVIKGAMSGLKPSEVRVPKATPQSITMGAGAGEVLKEIGDLKTILKKEPKSIFAHIPLIGRSAQARGVKLPFIAPYGITEKGQEYRTLRESINNRLLYLRSGAQINDKEYKRLSGMLPEIFRSDKVDLQQLDRFENEFKNILSKISGNVGQDEFSNMSDDELRKLAGL